MSNNCLVTKYKATVNNSNLPKLGELTINFSSVESPSTGSKQFKVYGSKSITIKVVGGFLSTTYGSVSGETEVTIPATSDPNTVPMYYVSNTDCKILVSSKYDITFVRIGTSGYMNIDDLKYSVGLSYLNANDCARVTGKLSSISDKTGITSLHLRGSQVTGDISELSGLISIMVMNLTSTAVTGNIASLSAMTSATDIQMSNTNINGDVNSLAGLTSLVKLLIASCKSVYGDATAFVSRNNWQDISSLFNGTKVIADISQVPASVAFVSALGTLNRTFKWKTSRHAVSGAKMVALQCSVGVSGVNFGDDLKAMLVDQSQCTFAPQGTASWYKIIDVAGTYDSSDAELAAAITTIKTAGMTVKINGNTI